MKLLRYGPVGKEKPGILDADGKIRDLSDKVADISGKVLSPEGLAKLAKVKIDKLPVVKGKPRLAPPVSGISKLVCCGLNYSDHAAETGATVPPEPVLFMKATSCIVGPNDNVMLPKGSKKTDWEVELGVVIGTTARYVGKADALKHVAGYTIVNDVSEREFQIERSGTWMKGKSADTFGPIGPYLVTPDEIKDPQKLAMFCEVNGKRFQDGSTKTMVYNVKFLVHYISQFMTLYPGDVIATGTPPGVGMGQKPQLFLKAGDVMHLGIDGLGTQTQNVVAFKA